MHNFSEFTLCKIYFGERDFIKNETFTYKSYFEYIVTITQKSVFCVSNIMHI